MLFLPPCFGFGKLLRMRGLELTVMSSVGLCGNSISIVEIQLYLK